VTSKKIIVKKIPTIVVPKVDEPTFHAGRERKQHFIVVEVYYKIGGSNFATFKNDPRGYYMSVSPEFEERYTSGLVGRGFEMFSGLGKFVEEAKAFGAKKLAALAAAAESDPDLNKMIVDVLTRNAALRLVNADDDPSDDKRFTATADDIAANDAANAQAAEKSAELDSIIQRNHQLAAA
jgi:hypothetical protein